MKFIGELQFHRHHLLLKLKLCDYDHQPDEKRENFPLSHDSILRIHFTLENTAVYNTTRVFLM